MEIKMKTNKAIPARKYVDEGRAAFAAGNEVCPYPLSTEAIKRHYWRIGYDHAKRAADCAAKRK